jgi:hypothetical protein
VIAALSTKVSVLSKARTALLKIGQALCRYPQAAIHTFDIAACERQVLAQSGGL